MKTDTSTSHITTALIPAAGQGKRLHPHTINRPKCLIDAGDKPLLAHTIEALEKNGYERLILITGHCHRQVDAFLEQYNTTLDVQTVYNDRYDTTNNIYSVWLAGSLIRDAFLLLESDLIFDAGAIATMNRPNRIALDRYNPGKHTGTTAAVTSDNRLAELHVGGIDMVQAHRKNGHMPTAPCQNPPGKFSHRASRKGLSCSNQSEKPTDRHHHTLYKTVNMCTFCISTWHRLHHAISSRLAAGYQHDFYELAVRDLLIGGAISLEMADFSGLWWDEIDCTNDLARVEARLSGASKKVSRYEAG
ncbi:NTP transferase domain-containing protein [Balneolales bacterium ANBcel1]|nr:NTP transferase domain-containing protein [Balneolales bacterium ANBcel1]